MLTSIVRTLFKPSVRMGFRLIVLAFIIVIPVNFFVAEPFIVSGISMQPTFDPGDYLVIDRLTYDIESPQRGDVVVFRYPLDPSMYLIKRIEALPGETVNEATGQVVPRPSGEQHPLDATTSTLTLASDEYFVLGDNSTESSDSRTWGPLQRKFIVGRVLFRLWPL